LNDEKIKDYQKIGEKNYESSDVGFFVFYHSFLSLRARSGGLKPKTSTIGGNAPLLALFFGKKGHAFLGLTGGVGRD
jgi:hypothetical protein